MTKKKETIKKDKTEKEATEVGKINTQSELKEFLLALKDRMAEETAAPIYVVSVMNHIMSSDNIYSLLTEESKELARDIWLRLQASGMQLRKPPLLFGETA